MVVDGMFLLYIFIVLAKLLIQKIKVLNLRHTQITDAGCATLTAALGSRSLPALEWLFLDSISVGPLFGSLGADEPSSDPLLATRCGSSE